MKADELARLAGVVHEVNRALQAGHGDEAPSQPWACEDPGIRALTVAGVQRALAGVTPQAHHDAWCEQKRAQGWRYGPDKDPEAKTHPNLLSYGQLPAHQQAKDRIFLAVVAELSREMR